LIFLAPYGYDRMFDGKPMAGVPTERLGSQARIDALIKKRDRGALIADFESSCWVLVAGFSKDSPCQPTENTRTSLAEDMRKYLTSLGYQLFLGGPKCWGTYEETREIIQEIRRVYDYEAEIFVSTNLGHMPRVRLCWFFLKPKNWEVNFVEANHSFTPKECFHETAKFFVYLYRFLFKKW
jgi:hypothetical protein